MLPLAVANVTVRLNPIVAQLISLRLGEVGSLTHDGDAIFVMEASHPNASGKRAARRRGRRRREVRGMRTAVASSPTPLFAPPRKL
tara:strand:- start:1161 stop:1418 length:258 start_codon:yes stop_codon:yes gene_type:complete